MNPNWRHMDSGRRPSGKQFSFRLTDKDRAQLVAAVKLDNDQRGRGYVQPTIGDYVRKAALAAAAAQLKEAGVEVPSGPTTDPRQAALPGISPAAELKTAAGPAALERKLSIPPKGYRWLLIGKTKTWHVVRSDVPSRGGRVCCGEPIVYRAKDNADLLWWGEGSAPQPGQSCDDVVCELCRTRRGGDDGPTALQRVKKLAGPTVRSRGPTEKATCTAIQKNGKRCISGARFDGKHGKLCAAHVNAEHLAEKSKARQSGRGTCPIPGCGAEGAGARNRYFCKHHAKSLSVVEQKSILARNKRLQAEGKLP